MRRPSESLALRLAIVSGLQVIALIVVTSLAVPISNYVQDRASPQGIVREVISVLDDSAVLQERLEQLRSVHHFDLSLYDAEEQLVASNVTPALRLRRERFEPVFTPHGDEVPPGPPPRGLLGPLLPSWVDDDNPSNEPPTLVIPLHSESEPYTLVLRVPQHRYSILPLLITVSIGALVVALGAVLTRRFVTLPLERLSKVVGAFGAGQFTSRSDVKRRDEVGVLASTFNQMADRIQHMRETERELLTNVTHELRTPLARIRVALEIAEESGGQSAKSAIFGIREDLSELEGLLEDVLTAVKLRTSADTTNWVLRPDSLSLFKLLENLMLRFNSHHPDRTLLVEKPPADTTIVADEILLRRAISNLLENAHKYTPNGRLPITLRAYVRDNDCRFEVEDSGIGIEAVDREKVFLPFYRTEQSRSKMTGGAGLGLTLAKRITEAHGGSVTLESNLGIGTLARVSVPLVARQPSTPPESGR